MRTSTPEKSTSGTTRLQAAGVAKVSMMTTTATRFPATCRSMSWRTSTSANAQFYMLPNDSFEEVSYLSFSDNTDDDGHRAWAASPFVVCHEYQHGITAHSVGGTAPGFPSGFDDWARALSEGLSDVFGGMYSGNWYAGDGFVARRADAPQHRLPARSRHGR